MKSLAYIIPSITAGGLLMFAVAIIFSHPYLSIFDAWMGGIFYAIAYNEYRKVNETK